MKPKFTYLTLPSASTQNLRLQEFFTYAFQGEETINIPMVGSSVVEDLSQHLTFKQSKQPWYKREGACTGILKKYEKRRKGKTSKMVNS